MDNTLPAEYPFDEDNVFGICKACGIVIPADTIRTHKSKCRIPPQLRQKIKGSLFTILSGSEINELLLNGKSLPVYKFSDMEIEFYNDFQNPYEDKEKNAKFQDALTQAIPNEEYIRRRDERRRQRELRDSIRKEEVVDEEEEERRRKERREQRRQRREAAAALEEDRRREEAQQLEHDAQMFIHLVEEEQERKRKEEEEERQRQLEKEAEEKKKKEEEQSLLQSELSRLRVKIEEEKKLEEEKKQRKREDELRMVLEIERQRDETDRLKQKEIERLKREKEYEILNHSSQTPVPEEENELDVMVRQQEEEKREASYRRKEEERNWQKREIELELNHSIALSDSKEIKRCGQPRPARPVQPIAQNMINKKYAVPAQPRSARIQAPAQRIVSVDLGVNPFDDDDLMKMQAHPSILPQPKKTVVNPFGREEDVLNRLENHQEVSAETTNPFDESSRRNPFDEMEGAYVNPFDEETPSYVNPFDSRGEPSVNPFDTNEKETTNLFDSPKETNPFNRLSLNSSTSSMINPFDRLSIEGRKLNPFDSSDEGDDEEINSFDRKSFNQSSIETPTSVDPRESVSSMTSVWKNAVKVLELANNPDISAAELQHQMEETQKEKQMNAVTNLYETNEEEYLSFVNTIFEGVECWKWCSNGKYHKTTLRVFDLEDQRILQWDRKKGLFKDKTGEIDCSTITSVENIPGTNQIVIECERTVIFECFTKSSLISLFPGLKKMCLEKW